MIPAGNQNLLCQLRLDVLIAAARFRDIFDFQQEFVGEAK